METAAVFAASATERRALAAELADLTPQQWTTPSLCTAWDVRTVVGHLVAALSPTPLPFLGAILRAGGRLHHANDALARQTARQPTADLVAALRQRADSRASPPVIGPRGPLTDVLVHAGDIRLPLALAHKPADDAIRKALDFVTNGRPVGFVPRGRLAALKLVAEDLDSSWGDGEVVAGTAINLLMAACGRTAVLHRLHGDGVRVLAHRLTT